jgi:hypothetical protein
MESFEQEIRQHVTMQWQTVVNYMEFAPGVFVQDPEIKRDYMRKSFETLLLGVEAVVLGQKRPDKVVNISEPIFFEYPASPFQHWKFKHKYSWWMKWFVRWRPVIITQKVKTCEVTVSWAMTDVYPNQTVVSPQLGQPYVIIDAPNSKVWVSDE